MGYTTDFNGYVTLDKPLNKDQIVYLKQFNRTRHMRLKPEVETNYPCPARQALGLPFGEDGEFQVRDQGEYSWNEAVDYNTPPGECPSLWCDWTVSDDGTRIEWDDAEKFYEYVDWMDYLIRKFIKPWGYVANGDIEWFGEDHNDFGLLIVKDNIVSVRVGQRTLGRQRRISEK